LSSSTFPSSLASIFAICRGRSAGNALNLATGFDVPLELSPVVEPSAALAVEMADGRLEGVVFKDRTSPYRDGSRAGWFKVKDPSWYEREAWRFESR
jgi:hypothetical protein